MPLSPALMTAADPGDSVYEDSYDFDADKRADYVDYRSQIFA